MCYVCLSCFCRYVCLFVMIFGLSCPQCRVCEVKGCVKCMLDRMNEKTV